MLANIRRTYLIECGGTDNSYSGTLPAAVPEEEQEEIVIALIILSTNNIINYNYYIVYNTVHDNKINVRVSLPLPLPLQATHRYYTIIILLRNELV